MTCVSGWDWGPRDWGPKTLRFYLLFSCLFPKPIHNQFALKATPIVISILLKG